MGAVSIPVSTQSGICWMVTSAWLTGRLPTKPAFSGPWLTAKPTTRPKVTGHGYTPGAQFSGCCNSRCNSETALWRWYAKRRYAVWYARKPWLAQHWLAAWLAPIAGGHCPLPHFWGNTYFRESPDLASSKTGSKLRPSPMICRGPARPPCRSDASAQHQHSPHGCVTTGAWCRSDAAHDPAQEGAHQPDGRLPLAQQRQDRRGQVQAAAPAASGLACFIFRFLKRPQEHHYVRCGPAHITLHRRGPGAELPPRQPGRWPGSWLKSYYLCAYAKTG